MWTVNTMLSRTPIVAETSTRVFVHSQRLLHNSNKGIIGNAIDKTMELASEATDKLKDAYKTVVGSEQAGEATQRYANAAMNKNAQLRDKHGNQWKDVKSRWNGAQEAVEKHNRFDKKLDDETFSGQRKINHVKHQNLKMEPAKSENRRI
ncbi:unnamed protein product [Caenorhabditis auriculariae]|uniref:Uncharacterized protein n=1 Tax=Caenorhabditis auriculariae TaxID=2777116 RepID=A0A8S1HYX7_9PELO|nr:unnamed protein product [Caenorhabditis auriculariae]